MGKTAEQRRQESLKRISSEVQELRQQLKRVKLDCGDADLDTSDGVKSCPQGGVQAAVDNEHVNSVSEHSSQSESVQQLLKSCEDQRRFCEGIYGALIKLVGEVGQPREDNAKCIQQLCDFTKELRDQEKTFFSKIEQVRSQSQHLNELQDAQVERLDKWKRVQKQQVEGVEKLLSSLLHQGMMEKRQVSFIISRLFLLNYAQCSYKNHFLNSIQCKIVTININAFTRAYFYSITSYIQTGLLISRNGAILHSRPEIASDRTIHEKLHNSQKKAQHS